MSIFDDLKEIHDKFEFPRPNSPQLLMHKTMYDRLEFCLEELNETADAVDAGDLEEAIDGLIDLIYVAAGTLDMMGVQGQLHFDEVHKANMRKEKGHKPGRDMEHDMMKPEGWVGPDHMTVLRSYDGE